MSGDQRTLEEVLASEAELEAANAELEQRLEEFHASSMEMAMGISECFQVLSEEADLLYLHDAAYEASAARSIHVDSPVLGIRLPLPIRSICDRDRNARRIDADFTGIRS